MDEEEDYGLTTIQIDMSLTGLKQGNCFLTSVFHPPYGDLRGSYLLVSHLGHSAIIWPLRGVFRQTSTRSSIDGVSDAVPLTCKLLRLQKCETLNE